MKNIIFIAPPSAGKGTQSDMLVEKYGYKHISTGNLFRAEIATGSDLGIKLKEIIDQGNLIDDETTKTLLLKEFNDIETNFILDGYPRNIDQANTLEEILIDTNQTNYVAIYLDIDKQTAMERALGRITCDSCGASYNIYYDKLKPSVDGICDKCNSELAQRNDDNEETFNKRFDTFLEKTKPLTDFYQNLDKLKSVKVMAEKADTFAGIESVIND